MHCTGCYYYRYIGAGSREKCCHFCIVTGEVRGISAKECYKKKDGTRYKPSSTSKSAQKQNRVDLHI